MEKQRKANKKVEEMAKKRTAVFIRRYQLDRPYLRGMSNIPDIFATTYSLDFILRSDQDALRSDIRNIGDDMRMAIARFQY